MDLFPRGSMEGYGRRGTGHIKQHHQQMPSNERRSLVCWNGINVVHPSTGKKKLLD